MEPDPVRETIRDLLWRRGLTMREVSLAIGRNVAYLHGFLERESPRVLSYQDAGKLAGVLGCDATALHHAERPPRRKRASRKRGQLPNGQKATGRGSGVDKSGPDTSGMDGAPLAAIPEVEVEASAGPGALADEFVAERARWFLPEGMIRHEAGAAPGAIRVLRVRGNSMEPELSDGDRLLIDTARRVPATGELFVLWDGGGLVVKRIEHVHDGANDDDTNDDDGGDASRLRLKSANPDYADYTCLAEEVHIVGKVLWTVKRVS